MKETLAVRELYDQQPFFLASMPPSQGQRRFALGIVVVLLIAFGLTAPIANAHLPRVE